MGSGSTWTTSTAPGCAIKLDADGKGERAKFKAITVRKSNRNAAGRRELHKNRGMVLSALNWVMSGGKPPREYKPATAVGRNGRVTNSPVFNLLAGRLEYVLVRNDPGPTMRRLLGIGTLRVCEGCYNEKFKAHPQQLQKQG